MATASLSAALPVVELKNILIPTDFSDDSRQVLPYVAQLAQKFGSTVHLCHFVTPGELVFGAPEAAPQRYEAEHRTSEKALEELRCSPEMRGLNVRTNTANGILKEELVKAIAANHIDLVVVSTHGRTGMSRSALGSVADLICRTAACPVLTIGPEIVPQEEMRFRRILVPTDFDRYGALVLPYVSYIAREYHAAITVLHVIPTDSAVNANASLMAKHARRVLKRALGKECGDPHPQFLIEFGHPAETILRAAAENKADLIAMGIRPALMPEVHLSSGVAYQVMAAAQCPVLTCR